MSLSADEEALPFRDGSLDLVVSALALQFVNDLPGTLVQIRRALKPDGLFLAAMIGGESLTELREAFAQAEAEIEGGVSPRVAPFADLRDLGALLQRAGFALPVTDIDRVTVRYATPLALMHDLRRMGAANALTERRRMPLRRATLRRMFEIYAERFADPDGRMRATFEIVWLSGWAPHESQQKPLAPGSARRGSPMRCARARFRPAKRPAAELRKRVASCRRTRLRRLSSRRYDGGGDDAPTPSRRSWRIRSRWRRCRRARSATVAAAVGCVSQRHRRFSCGHSSVIRCAISGSSAGGIW